MRQEVVAVQHRCRLLLCHPCQIGIELPQMTNLLQLKWLQTWARTRNISGDIVAHNHEDEDQDDGDQGDPIGTTHNVALMIEQDSVGQLGSLPMVEVGADASKASCMDLDDLNAGEMVEKDADSEDGIGGYSGRQQEGLQQHTSGSSGIGEGQYGQQKLPQCVRENEAKKPLSRGRQKGMKFPNGYKKRSDLSQEHDEEPLQAERAKRRKVAPNQTIPYITTMPQPGSKRSSTQVALKKESKPRMISGAEGDFSI